MTMRVEPVLSQPLFNPLSSTALLLQIRPEPDVQREELDSFVRHSGLRTEQLKSFNVYDQPDFSPDIMAGHQALFVGGSSSADVTKPNEFPFVVRSIELLQYCLQHDIPVFASCFGFQLAVLALGGKILHQDEGYEMGIMSIFLNSQAQNDPVFQGVPDSFMAVSVHQQHARELPDACDQLAFTDNSIHAFRVKGKPFWAFQFHPEIDRATFVQRLQIYQAKYAKGDGERLRRVLNAAVETPEANALVRRFVEVISGQKRRQGKE